MKSNKIEWKLMRSNEVKWNLMKSDESSEIYWDLLKSNDIQWNPMESNDIQFIPYMYIHAHCDNFCMHAYKTVPGHRELPSAPGTYL